MHHSSILPCASRQGAPKHLIKYLKNAYQGCTTTLHCHPSSPEIKMTRGVKQGDPLPPILFNSVIDEVVASLPSKLGVKIGDQYINALAFADDLCIATSSTAGLQSCLNQLQKEAACASLVFNPSKSATISKNINRQIRFSTNTFKINGETIPALKPEDQIRYLRARFSLAGQQIGKT